MAQIKTWVANTWVKLLQTTGQSTNKAMSQKAVTDSLDSLKSDLVAKSDSLTYEEIMASTDLTNKVASAESINNLVNKLPKTLIFQLSAGTPTKTYTLESNINYLLINADNPLGVWILAQSGYNRMIGTIINGGWDGATFSIDNNTLTALTLLIAESNPKEKEIIVDLVMNFLNNE